MLELIAQPNNRTSRERLIAVGRLVLSGFSLVAIYLDPSEPARYADLTYALLAGYVAYAAALMALLQSLPLMPLRFSAVTHAIDLAAFVVLVYFTEGPTSPFFVFFVFSLICATIRWQWRGTLWTGLVAVAGFIALGIYSTVVLQDSGFELNRFLIRGVYLVVLTVLLGYLGAYNAQLQHRLAGLVSWPSRFARDEHAFLKDLLECGVASIGAQRAIMVWRESAENFYHAASLAGGEFRYSMNEPRFAARSPVVEPLGAASFLCNRPLSPLPRVLYSAPDGFALFRGSPLNNDFRSRFSIDAAVLSSVMRGEFVDGRLFFIGKRAMNSDDLTLAEIVSHLIVTRMDNWQLLKRLRESAAVEERERLGNSLHATVFQSLAATGLQMELIGRLLQKDPEGAKDLLAKAQDQLSEGTRTMRSIVVALKETERSQARKGRIRSVSRTGEGIECPSGTAKVEPAA